ncbi:MAG: hypothetical protein ACE5FH_04315 [Candidatus Zixiibacteriota bacterium]
MLIATATLALGMMVAAATGTPAASNGNGRTMIVRVNAAPLAWSNSQLQDIMERELTRSTHYRLLQAGAQDATAPPGSDNLDGLINWGTEQGTRYILLVRVDDERLAREKTFRIPLVFQRWESMGTIEGETRLVDIRRGRVVFTETFRVRQSGARAIRAWPDDTSSDPDLQLSAPEKVRFFAKLEKKLAQHLVKRLLRETRR